MKEGIIRFIRLFWPTVKKFFESRGKIFAALCSCFLVVITTISLVDARLLPFVFPPNEPDFIHFYAGKTVTFTGVVHDEPDIRVDSARYSILASSIELGENIRVVSGRVYVKYDLYPRFQYGDTVQVKCTLKIPGVIEDKETGGIFRYDMHLALQRIFSVCEYPRIEKTGDGAGDPVFSFILRTKNSVAEKITALWPEPEASFMAGLLYGYRGGLGPLNDIFGRTGVTHIVAISGFNITIIASIFINFFIYLCVPRRTAFWFVSAGIALFVIFTGASASVVRAGAMGTLALFAAHVGRRARMGNMLLFAAVLMTAVNPLSLLYDAGFQLSFLSTIGLVYLSPVFTKVGCRIPEFLGMRENIVATCSAIIATLPLILFQFGRLSVVAPLVNVLILWIIPWLMLAGVLAVFAGFLFAPLGELLAWFGWIGMKYVIVTVEFFARMRFASVDLRVSAFAMLAMYGIIIYYIYKNQSQK